MFVTDAEFKKHRKSLRIPIKSAGTANHTTYGNNRKKVTHIRDTPTGSCLNYIKPGYQHYPIALDC
jgi:uncharacterized protein (DUF1499 family)